MKNRNKMKKALFHRKIQLIKIQKKKNKKQKQNYIKYLNKKER